MGAGAVARQRRALELEGLDKKVRSVWHAGRRFGETIRNHIVNAVKVPYRAVRRPLRAASRRRAHLQERWQFYRTEWSIEREIEAIVSRDRLLVAGPWLSEVGFETLYWVPFLHWLEDRVPYRRRAACCRLARRCRRVVFGRGGALRRDLG